MKAIAEDLRAWRIVGANSGIAQALRPSGTVRFAATRNWILQAAGAYSDTLGFHSYDAVQTSFSATYAVPFHRGFQEETGKVALQYPIRFTGGIQQEDFFNFSGPHGQQFRPYISISLF